MRIASNGRLTEEPRIRAGFIGCGSHSFRNIYPTFQFAPVELVATCDLDLERARAFARQFGAGHAYADHREMLAHERLDAVFIVTGYDAKGRPLYPTLAAEVLQAGCHAWIEKPPAASCREIETLRAAAERAGRHVAVGFKKMFFPANRKAKELMEARDFGRASLLLLQYPQGVPTLEEFAQYAAGTRNGVVGFLDHLCHPVSLLLFLAGMPATLYYERSSSGAAAATFTYPSGLVASIALTHGAASNAGMERTVIVSDRGRHITVENNHRLTYHRNPPDLPYGQAPSYFQGTPEQVNAVWEPEFSLGQLYNKGLFLLGYYDEVNEFARAVLEKRAPRAGTLEHAWQATRIFEAFAQGPGRVTQLSGQAS
jgi:predicted dehydrogenase